VKRQLFIVLPVAVYVLLRVPSFFEPQWYQDEAGYASTVWLTHLGYGLYVNAWNNKPPLLFGIYGLAQFLWGPSEAGIHLLGALSGLVAMIAAVWGMARLFSRRAALWGGLAAAVLIGTPIFDGNLALPESLLIGPVTVAVTLFLCSGADPDVRRPRAVTLAGIGVLFACGILIQQTAVADFASVVLWCLVRARWRSVSITAVAFLLTVAGVLLPVVVSVGLHNVWFALVTSYGDYLNYSLHAQFAPFAFRVVVIIAIVAAAWANRNAADGRLELLRIWATAALFAAVASGYSYEHFLLPMAIPTVLLVTGIVSHRGDHLVRRLRQPGVALGAATLTLIASTGWSLFAAGYRSAVWSAGYYANAISYMTGAISEVEYDRYYGVPIFGEKVAEAWISAHGLTGSTAMVWSNLAWPLVDEQLVPPTRSGPLYVTLALEHGTAQMIAMMDASPPKLILITPYHVENLQVIQDFVASHAYRQVLDESGVALFMRSGS
jgi:hypothetical protein